MRPILLFSCLMAITTLVSCGGAASDLPHRSDVIVTLTPSTATIRVGGTIDLQGEVTGLSDPFWIDFWMQEQHDAGTTGSENCDHITPNNAELIAGCRFGYLTGATIQQSASAVATYHAASTPGTYHVTFRAFQMSMRTGGGWIEKRTTTTIVVTD
jgi:hypothetical protein